MFSPKRYTCVCPVCGAGWSFVSRFVSAPLMVEGKDGRTHCGLHCGRHTLAEVRDGLGMLVGRDEDPERVAKQPERAGEDFRWEPDLDMAWAKESS